MRSAQNEFDNGNDTESRVEMRAEIIVITEITEINEKKREQYGNCEGQAMCEADEGGEVTLCIIYVRRERSNDNALKMRWNSITELRMRLRIARSLMI